MTTDTFQPIRPCFFMKTLLSAACDNALAGLARSFTEWHVAHCPRCTAALTALRALQVRLRSLVSLGAKPDEALTPERWAQIESAWTEADG